MKFLNKSLTLFLTSLLALSLPVSNYANENNTVIAPVGANKSQSPILVQTAQNITYHLRDINVTIPKTYTIERSDYSQQLFFTNNSNHSILAIQTLYVPKAEILNHFIPQVKDNAKLTNIVGADLTNVLKNIIFDPKAYITLNPLTQIGDRNIITYSGYITVNKIKTADPNNPDVEQSRFNVSGAEIYYGQYLYLTFALAPKQSIPFDNSTILNNSIKAVLDHLQTLPLASNPPADKKPNNNIPLVKAETGNNLPPAVVK